MLNQPFSEQRPELLAPGIAEQGVANCVMMLTSSRPAISSAYGPHLLRVRNALPMSDQVRAFRVRVGSARRLAVM